MSRSGNCPSHVPMKGPGPALDPRELVEIRRRRLFVRADERGGVLGGAVITARQQVEIGEAGRVADAGEVEHVDEFGVLLTHHLGEHHRGESQLAPSARGERVERRPDAVLGFEGGEVSARRDGRELQVSDRDDLEGPGLEPVFQPVCAARFSSRRGCSSRSPRPHEMARVHEVAPDHADLVDDDRVRRSR